ncbi:MAG: beta-ketoacyl-ACP synthase II [Chloroflexota bacterium]|nr:beta-ketoacyl-ACP synthase II [Dehalococcoidia bacterium]MDW8254543.1 beta-ketoacyl-ACP synthase II [Chloroflexota bacterium]
MTSADPYSASRPPRSLLEQSIEEAVEEAEEALGRPPEARPLLESLRPGRARHRVVVTGLGAMTALGESPDAFWAALLAGESGVGPMTLTDPTNYPCRIAAEVRTFDPRNYLDAKEARRMARFTQLAVAAADQAIQAAGLRPEAEDRDRIGVLIGNGNGGFPNIDAEMRTLVARGGMKVSPLFFPMILPNMAASQISLRHRLTGYSSTVTTACAAATQAIGEAVELIRRGAQDVMIAGGTEAGISELGLAGFCVMRALATDNDDPPRASRPFDLTRNGFVPAEGAAILILESLEHALAREAVILAEITGYGASADAYHLVAPDPEGRGAALAMLRAIADAGLSPSDISWINAHATSTELGDVAETNAIKRAFGEAAYRIPVSATKSMIGHALGAAGGLEAVACVLAIRDQQIHPTINLRTPDPACDLDYVTEGARKIRVQHVLSNSFGFGGQNACLVFSRYERVD